MLILPFKPGVFEPYLAGQTEHVSRWVGDTLATHLLFGSVVMILLYVFPHSPDLKNVLGESI